MGEDLHKQVQAYFTDLGKVGGEGTHNCLCQGIYTEKDSGLLAENGGLVALTND